MTIFLAAVSRRQSASAGDESITRIRRLGLAVADGYDPYLGEGYTRQPDLVTPTPDGHVCTVVWRRSFDEWAYHSEGRHWAVSGGTPVASGIAQSVRRIGGRLVYTDPVWGMYACVLGESEGGTVTAWNTAPALEAIHYAVTDEYVLISNRPLVVALARSAGVSSDVQLSSAFVDEYLMYGYSITGQTAFDGVHTLDPSRALSVHRGAVRHVDIPAGLGGGLSTSHSADEGAEALAAALSDAAERSMRQLNGSRLQLRMSGGKDSRLLLGLLRRHNRSIYAVTMGRVGDPEVSLAAELTERAAVEHYVRSPILSPGYDLRDKVSWTIARSDGQPPTEAHQSIYRGADPLNVNDGITFGQWPLMKGGLARSAAHTEDEARSLLKAQGSWILRDDLREGFDEYLQNWFGHTPAQSVSEKLYLFSRTFRSGRWLQPQTTLMGRDAVNVYPISDSEVTAVVDVLHMSEKVDESAYFNALTRIWPPTTQLPLRGSMWSFEVDGPHPKLSGSHYESRTQTFTPRKYPHLVDKRTSTARISEYADTTLIAISKELCRSSRRDELLDRIAPRLRDVITVAAAEGEVRAPRGRNSRQVAVAIWRVYCAEVWQSGDWLHR